MGARLRPGIGSRLFKIAAREACGPRLALSEFDSAAARAFATCGLKQLTKVLIDLFRQRHRDASTRIAGRAAALISARQGRISAEEVASELGCSTRHLHRAMIADLGLGPKTAARIARIRCAVALLGAGNTTLAAAAIDAGYADQAHMTREFSILGMPSPARLRHWDESDFVNTAEHGRL
jgi:AraC-like DNA-binding protein